VSKFISVPTAWAVYSVPDETFQLLPNGMATTPPQVVLEMMVMNGQAKRVARIGDFEIEGSDDERSVSSDEYTSDGARIENSEPEPGVGPWYNEDDDEEEGVKDGD
jgi:hypothetical protein